MTAQIIPFPNADEVEDTLEIFAFNAGPRRFIVEDTRCFVVYGEDEQDALDKFIEFDEEEERAAMVEGGDIQVFPADQ